jgi:hypothetical protein
MIPVQLVDLGAQVVALLGIVAVPAVVGFEIDLFGKPFLFEAMEIGFGFIQFCFFLAISCDLPLVFASRQHSLFINILLTILSVRLIYRNVSINCSSHLMREILLCLLLTGHL